MYVTIKKYGQLFLLSLSMLGAMPAYAASLDEKKAIQQRLAEMIPNPNDAVITATAVKGLYQVQLGLTIVYMSADAAFMVNGNMVELDTRQNLTEQARNEYRKKIMDTFDVESMLAFPAKGKEKHVITVFTDIDCPYCVRLHQEVSLLNNSGVTVRYISFPRSGPNTPSYAKAIAVWCSKDQKKAMDDVMLRKVEGGKQCNNHPIDKHIGYVRALEVNGTPNIMLDDGSVLAGYVPALELLKILDSKDKVAK